MKLIYVSGKYSDVSHAKIWRNVRLALRYSASLMRMGFGVICPHGNTIYDYFSAKEGKNLKIPYEHYIETDLKIVGFCDAIFMLPNWKRSPGAIREKSEASALGKKILYSLKESRKWKNALH